MVTMVMKSSPLFRNRTTIITAFILDEFIFLHFKTILYIQHLLISTSGFCLSGLFFQEITPG